MNSEKIEHLIEQSKKNDTAAFRQLVETFQPLVFRLAFRLLCNDDEAKDIVQETFTKVWLHLNKFRHGAKFSTWLYKIACNLCYDRLRAIKRSQGYSTTDFDLSQLDVASDQDMEQEFINRNLADWINALTHNLSPKQKMVFTLKDIEGMELDEIKKITGMSGAKIKSNLYLARQYIRKKIEN